MTNPPTLFDDVTARLPLFDDLPEEIVERLAAGGFGRGLLTASLRARLRKAGYNDMGALALATPSELSAVRKIGPVRVATIRAHLLGELARFVPSARPDHDRNATDRRRLERLRAMPGGWLGRAGETCADLALRRCAEIRVDHDIPAAALDEIAAALALALLPERPQTPASAATPEDDAAREERAARARAEMLQERDREWDEADPAAEALPAPMIR